MKYIFLGSGEIAKRCLEMTLRQGEDFWPNGIVGDSKCLEPFNECETVNKHTLKNSNKPEVVIQMIEEIEPDFIV